MKTPEVILVDIINNILLFLREDYISAGGDKTKTMLYKLWYGIVDDKYDYYREAVSLFALRKKDNPRNLNCRLYFDREKAHIPTFHVTLLSENSGEDSLGVGEDDEIEINDIENTADVFYERRFDTQLYIICTSDNNRELMLMYRTIRSMIISVWDTFSLKGFEKMRVSGGELKLDELKVPNHIYAKGIGLNFSYNERVPRIFPNKLIKNIILKGELKKD